MGNNTKVVINKGGFEEKEKKICDIEIPDIWHIAESIREGRKLLIPQDCADLILECWSRAHDFKRHIQEN